MEWKLIFLFVSSVLKLLVIFDVQKKRSIFVVTNYAKTKTRANTKSLAFGVILNTCRITFAFLQLLKPQFTAG